MLFIYTIAKVEDRKKAFVTSNTRTDYSAAQNQHKQPRVRGMFMEYFREENTFKKKKPHKSKPTTKMCCDKFHPHCSLTCFRRVIRNTVCLD